MNTPAEAPLQVCHFGLRFSPNVGDGIISECLEHGLRTIEPDLRFRPVDISGRTAFGERTVPARRLVMSALDRLPQAVRHVVVRGRLDALLRRVGPSWDNAAKAADVVVVGGGQILADRDLNFPKKIARVFEATARSGSPVAIHAAGAASDWSREGEKLFSTWRTARLVHVSFRDAASLSVWRERFADGDGPDACISRDPGLLAQACYGMRAADPDAPYGLGICDPGVLRYHGTGDDVPGVKTFAETAQAIASRGRSVLLFCNGAMEDRRALDATFEATRGSAHAHAITRAEPPRTPADLAGIVESVRAVAAHRLHACIVAYAAKRPVVGLAWDPKLDAFLDSIGAPAPIHGLSPVEIADSLQEAVRNGVDATAHANAVAEAQDGIAVMLDALRGAVRSTKRTPS